MHLLNRMIVVVMVTAVVVGCNKPKPKATGEEKIVPDAKVTADELSDAYQDNPVAADNKYKGKTIQIKGTISDFGQIALLGDYARLATSKEGQLDVYCFFYPNDQGIKDKVAKLKKGDTVTLIGQCQGKAAGILGINIRNCVFPD